MIAIPTTTSRLTGVQTKSAFRRGGRQFQTLSECTHGAPEWERSALNVPGGHCLGQGTKFWFWVWPKRTGAKSLQNCVTKVSSETNNKFYLFPFSTHDRCTSIHFSFHFCSSFFQTHLIHEFTCIIFSAKTLTIMWLYFFAIYSVGWDLHVLNDG